MTNCSPNFEPSKRSFHFVQEIQTGDDSFVLTKSASSNRCLIDRHMPFKEGFQYTQERFEILQD